MVLGKRPVPGRPTIWITVGQGPAAHAVGAGGSCLDIFTVIYPFSSLSPSLWKSGRYRLKYCLKKPLNPKQPTNYCLHLFIGVVESCGVKYQCVLPILIIEGQVPTALTVGAGGPDIVCNTVSKGRCAQNNQPTNHIFIFRQYGQSFGLVGWLF